MRCGFALGQPMVMQGPIKERIARSRHEIAQISEASRVVHAEQQKGSRLGGERERRL
jgi:hypothetical protein